MSCQKVDLGENFNLQINGKPQITKVEIINDQLIVTGKNLDTISEAKIEGSTNHTFAIESKTKTGLVLNTQSAATFIVGNLFDLILTNANGAATFPVSFTIQNGQVTGAKLNQMGASTGQVLQWNGTTWAPANPASGGQTYLGTYNAATDTPDIIAVGGSAGSFYIVTTAGTQDLGNGSISFAIGDWVSFNGVDWEKIPVGSNTVSSFNGRTGVVVPANDDYTWSMLGKTTGKLTGSRISEIADVDVTGIANGDILQWNGTVWTVVPFSPGTLANDSVTTPSVQDSAITTDKIANGTIVDADVSATAAIAQSKIAGLTTDLSGKEPTITAGTSSQYYRGDKTMQTLDTTAVTEGTNLYFTDTRATSAPIPMGYSPVVGVSDVAFMDPLTTAIAKVEGKVNDARTSIAGLVSSPWTTSGSNIYYNGGDVGIGTSSPGAKLEVAGQLKVTGGSPGLGKVLTSDATGLASWSDPSSGSFISNGLSPESLISTNRTANQLSFDLNGNMVMDVTGTGGAGNINQMQMTLRHGTVGAANQILFSHVGGQNHGWIGWDGTSMFMSSNSTKEIVFKTNSTTERMRINTAGNVGIGTATPLFPLQVNGDIGAGGVRSNANTTSFLGFSGGINLNTNNRRVISGTKSGNLVVTIGDASEQPTGVVNILHRTNFSEDVGIGIATPSEKLHVAGNILASGTITPSDKRLKENFRPIENALEKINQLQSVTYDWKEPEKHGEGRQMGVIAQEVEKAFPEAVKETKDGFLAVSYPVLISPLIAAVRELYQMNLKQIKNSFKYNSDLSKEIFFLKQENQKLKEDNRRLEKRLKKIEAVLEIK